MSTKNPHHSKVRLSPAAPCTRGECLCGQVRFELRGSLPKLYQCHCSLCRKQGGSSSNSATLVATENFRWLSGADGIRSWVKDTGFRSDFCSNCGSPVPNPLSNSAYVWVPTGLLDASAILEIGAHLFVASKSVWETIAGSGEQFATMPELSDLLELLHAKAPHKE